MITDILQSLLNGWYFLAAPPRVAEDAPLRERERVRLGQLTSNALLIDFIEILIGFGVAFTSQPGILLPLFGDLVLLIICTVLNRCGKTRISGILIITSIELTMWGDILGRVAQHKLGSFELPLFDFLVQP